MKINLINPEAISTLVTAVNSKLTAGEKVNRSTVLSCLGYSDSEAADPNLKNVISAAFNAGMVTGLKLTQKLGIVPQDHMTGKQQKEETRKVKEAARNAKAEAKAQAKAAKDAVKAQKAEQKAAKEAAKLAAKTAKTNTTADNA